MDAALNSKFEQILRLEHNPEKFEDEQQVTPYLRLITGFRYRLAVMTHRRWGQVDAPMEDGRFYQIMPDQVDNGFFDWYCVNRPFHQHFCTVEMAVLYFVFYWHIWQKEKAAAV
jgi:hypothetical protein